MPKAASTQVIIHRIEFQESEREIIRDLAMTWQATRIAAPIVSLINDNTTLLLILSAVAAWLGLNYIPPALEEGYDMILDFQQQLQSALDQGTIIRERVDLVGGAISRGPLWGSIDLAEAFFGINLPDFGAGYEPGGSSSQGSGGGGGF